MVGGHEASLWGADRMLRGQIGVLKAAENAEEGQSPGMTNRKAAGPRED